MSKKFTSAGKALTVGLTTPLIGFGALAAKTATDFDKASNQMRASLGGTSEDLKNYEEVMRDIYNNNFGESFEDVANSIAIVSKNLVDLDDVSLKKITESALTLRDVFGLEVNESVRAANAMMTNFGISSDQAMNLLSQGLNSNLDFSGEFIDNINEYSVQFKKLGFTAEDMFDIFQSGAAAGAWNLDKIGDAVKEFSIKAIDGSDTTIEGFKALGMNADTMAQKFASGGDTAKESFYEVIDAIGKMEDPVEQSIAGVNLFGTMWEDLGPEVVTQLGNIKGMYDSTVDSMENMKDVKYNDLGSMLEGIKRQFSDIALTLGNTLMPHIKNFTNWVSEMITKFQELSPETQTMIFKILGVAAAVGPLLILLGQIMPILSALPAIIGFIISPVGLVVLAIGALIGVFAYLMATSEEFRVAMQTIFTFVWSIIQPIIQNIMNLFNGLVQIIKGCILLIGGILTGDFSMIADGFGQIFRGIGNVVIAVLNGVINTINKFIKLALVPINGLIAAANEVPGVNIKKIKFSIPNIPALEVGTNYVEREGLAYLHQGEAVVPKKYNPAVGGNENNGQTIYVTVNADMDVNKFGKAFVRNVKTFSGGAKNTYNYGGGT